MLDEEYSSDIGNFLVLMIESHSWLEFLYLCLAIYITIPTKLMKADWVASGADFVAAKTSKWPKNIILKLLAPFGLMIIFVMCAAMTLLYSFFGLLIGAAVEAVVHRDNIFDYKQMIIETALLCAFSFAYCQIYLAFKKISELESEIDRIHYQKGLEEARLSRVRESMDK